MHKGTSYPGEHEAIVPKALWDRAHAVMAENSKKRAANSKAKAPALLKGLLYGSDGALMTPTHTSRRGRQYRYYISSDILKNGAPAGPLGRIPAGEIERLVIEQIAMLVRTPEIVVSTWKALRSRLKGMTEEVVRSALHQFHDIWCELFPAEQARVIQLLVERIDLSQTGAIVTLRAEGLSTLIHELEEAPRAAA